MAHERPTAFDDDQPAGGQIHGVREVRRPTLERAALAHALLLEGVECIKQATHLLEADAQPPQQSGGASVSAGSTSSRGL